MIDLVVQDPSIIAKILVALGITIEIIPDKVIKLSPLGWIGKRLNKSTNARIDKIQKQVDEIEYENDMRDVRNTKSRIHQIGLQLRTGKDLPYDMLKSALDDLDAYDYYKEKYHYMNINGKQIKINGEVEIDRQLIMDACLKKEGANMACKKSCKGKGKKR